MKFPKQILNKVVGEDCSVQHSWERAVGKFEEGLFVGESGATDWMGGVSWLGPCETKKKKKTGQSHENDMSRNNS